MEIPNPDFHRAKSPYDGVPVICAAMLLPPVCLYAVLRLLFRSWMHYSLAIQKAECLAFAFGIGFIVTMLFVISGGLKKPFKVMVSRLKDFFGDIGISAKLAFSCYWDAVKTDGVVFWIYMALIVLNLGLCLKGILQLAVLKVI